MNTFSKTAIRHPFLSLSFLLLLVGPLATSSHAQSYSNSGNNITGFTIKFGGGVTTNGSELVVAGGTWDTIPAIVTGNFRISYQVYNNSFDGDSHFLLLNPGTTGGIDVTNSPQSTDTPKINITSGTDFTNYNQYYFPTPTAVRASANTTSFPNQQWTSIIVSRNGNILTDNVGGQIIQTDVSSFLGDSVQLGLGGYATPYAGGVGQLLYRNVAAVPEPTAQSMLAVIFFLGLASLIRRNLSKPSKI